MKLSFFFITLFITFMGSEFDSVSGRPSIHVTTRVCDSRQFLNLYQRTCTFYGKRQRQSSIEFKHGSLRFQRDVSNEVELDPAPELARKCCEDGCSVELIALHCNSI